VSALATELVQSRIPARTIPRTVTAPTRGDPPLATLFGVGRPLNATDCYRLGVGSVPERLTSFSPRPAALLTVGVMERIGQGCRGRAVQVDPQLCKPSGVRERASPHCFSNPVARPSGGSPRRGPRARLRPGAPSRVRRRSAGPPSAQGRLGFGADLFDNGPMQGVAATGWPQCAALVAAPDASPGRPAGGNRCQPASGLGSDEPLAGGEIAAVRAPRRARSLEMKNSSSLSQLDGLTTRGICRRPESGCCRRSELAKLDRHPRPEESCNRYGQSRGRQARLALVATRRSSLNCLSGRHPVGPVS